MFKAFIKLNLLAACMSFAFSSPSHALRLDKSYNYAKRLNKSSWEKTNKNVFTHWRLDSNFRRLDRDSDNATIFRTKGTGVLQYRFTNDLRFFGSFDATFQTGRSQSRYGDLSPNSGVYVNDAYLYWSPYFKNEQISLEVGALDQDRTVSNKVLVKGSAFPGLAEKLNFRLSEDWSLKLRAQQLIPYSQTQETDLRSAEKTPFLFTESVELKLRKPSFNFSVKVGLYKYQDLPSAVANESRVLGNSVIGNGNTSRFEYDYRGWFTNLKFDFKLLDSLLVQSKVYLVENQEAPEKFNRGHKYDLSIHYCDESYEYGPYVSLFSIEPDASPAFYSASSMGYANREGWVLGFDLFVKKQRKNKFKVYLEYAQAKLLNKNLNAFQEDQRSIFMGIKTNFKRVVL